MHFGVGVGAENEAVWSEGDNPSSSLRDWGDAVLELDSPEGPGSGTQNRDGTNELSVMGRKNLVIGLRSS